MVPMYGIIYSGVPHRGSVGCFVRWITVTTLVMYGMLAPQSSSAQGVAEVQLAPVTITLGIGERRELLASAYDARGDNITTAQFSWTTSNPEVVWIEEDAGIPGIAVLIGAAPGLATVQARIGNYHASAAVQVTQSPGGRQEGRSGPATVLQIEPGSVFLLPSEGIQLSPVFLKDDGSPAARTPVMWKSLRSDVATVTAEGAVVGVSPGQGVIEASTPQGLLARVTVQVAQTEFAFGDPVLTLSPGQRDTIRTTVPEQNDRLLSPRRLVWRSTNSAVVQVSPIGLVTGIRAGSAQIVVSGFGQESRLPVVVHRPVEILEVAPKASAGTIGVPLGGSRTFTVRALADDDTPVTEAPLIWSISDTTVASLDIETGRVTGKAMGRADLTVKAPGEGLQVTWGLDVVSGGLALDAPAIAIGLSDETTLKASFLDDTGAPVSDAAGLEWISMDNSVVQVDDDGRVSPVSLGYASVIAATPWGAADTAMVYVLGDILVTSTRVGTADLFTFDRSKPGIFHRITDLPGSELSGVFSPDGTKIAFISDAGSSLDIYVADANGANAAPVASTPAQEGSPAWTPDGTRLVYESDEGGTIQIWIMDLDGTNKRQLTAGNAPNIQPTVSPDGTTIAFTSTRSGNYDIYLMNLDGSDQRYFTNSTANETQPEWAGNEAIVYIAEARSKKNTTRVVTRMELGRQTSVLTPEALAVSDFAISPAGDMLAVVVSAEGSRGRVERRLYLIPVTAAGMPIEVPRATDTDQLVTPSFRR